jgi:hypothetical protein
MRFETSFLSLLDLESSYGSSYACVNGKDCEILFPCVLACWYVSQSGFQTWFLSQYGLGSCCACENGTGFQTSFLSLLDLESSYGSSYACEYGKDCETLFPCALVCRYVSQSGFQTWFLSQYGLGSCCAFENGKGFETASQ